MAGGVTRSVVLGLEDVARICRGLRMLRVAASRSIADMPRELVAAREGAERDRDEADRVLETLGPAVMITATVPEAAGGEG